VWVWSTFNSPHSLVQHTSAHPTAEKLPHSHTQLPNSTQLCALNPLNPTHRRLSPRNPWTRHTRSAAHPRAALSVAFSPHSTARRGEHSLQRRTLAALARLAERVAPRNPSISPHSPRLPGESPLPTLHLATLAWLPPESPLAAHQLATLAWASALLGSPHSPHSLARDPIAPRAWQSPRLDTPWCCRHVGQGVGQLRSPSAPAEH
jgi:hypothetical protein